VAPHLGPELGGQGFGAVKLTLINEIIGHAAVGDIVFGNQRPGHRQREIIARSGNRGAEGPLSGEMLSGEIFSCFSMTEPQGGADRGSSRPRRPGWYDG